MALTNLRLGALAVAGCLVITALVFSVTPRPREMRSNPRYAMMIRETRRQRALSLAAERYRQVQLGDSLRSTPSTARYRFAPQFTAADRARAAALLARADLMRPAGPAFPIVVAFIVDTPSNAGYTSKSHLIPDRGQQCVSVFRSSAWRSKEGLLRGFGSVWASSWEYAADLLGPCGLYERFGPPGPAIDSWLREGGWKFGMNGVFSRPRLGYLQADRRFQRPNGFRWWGGMLEFDLMDVTSARGFRCITGDAAQCESILSLADNPRRLTVRPGGVLQQYWYAPYSTLGPAEPMLLADMARLFGDERFRAFWSSTQPPAESFRSATGRDFGAWVAEWARNTYGQFERGPVVPLRGVVWAALLLFGALAVSTRVATRREVG